MAECDRIIPEGRPPRAVADEVVARRQIKSTLGDILDRCPSWRHDLVRMEARLDHGKLSHDQARELHERCWEITDQLMQARLEILVNLADAPKNVTSNSRVVDIEKGLDNLEVSLNALKARLSEAAPK